MTEEDIREFVPDGIIVAQMVDQIMQALEQSSEAAYLVYLKLATKFGAGQRI